jgi:hypothetical protein
MSSPPVHRLLFLCLLVFACGDEQPEASPPPQQASVRSEPAGRDHLEATRAALDAIASGTVSDSLLLSSMPRIEREWTMQYQVFVETRSPLAEPFERRIDLVKERACEGDSAMARAALLYGLFVQGEGAQRFFDDDHRRPDMGARCANAQIFCAAFEELVAERGESALEPLDETCRQTRLDLAREAFGRWNMRNLSSAADRDLLASMPTTAYEFEQQRIAFTDRSQPELMRAADARLRQVARRACEGSRAMAYAYLRYWLLADRRGLGEDVPLPDRMDSCVRPQTYCAVMPDLVNAYGEDAVRLTSQVCSL